jgi:hypothetical protein
MLVAILGWPSSVDGQWLMLGAILGALFCGWAVWFMLVAILGWPSSVDVQSG